MEKDSKQDEKAAFLMADLSNFVQVPFAPAMGLTDNSTEVDDLKPDQEFAFIVYIIFAIICLVTALVLLYITYKVLKLVGASDKIIPTMLICLQLSAISKSAPSPQ